LPQSPPLPGTPRAGPAGLDGVRSCVRALGRCKGVCACARALQRVVACARACVHTCAYTHNCALGVGGLGACACVHVCVCGCWGGQGLGRNTRVCACVLGVGWGGPPRPGGRGRGKVANGYACMGARDVAGRGGSRPPPLAPRGRPPRSSQARRAGGLRGQKAAQGCAQGQGRGGTGTLLGRWRGWNRSHGTGTDGPPN
jgi:hypothetical protein